MLADVTHTLVANIPRKPKWVTGTGLGSPLVAEVKETKSTSFEPQVTGTTVSEDCSFRNDIIAGIDSGSSV